MMLRPVISLGVLVVLGACATVAPEEMSSDNPAAESQDMMVNCHTMHEQMRANHEGRHDRHHGNSDSDSESGAGMMGHMSEDMHERMAQCHTMMHGGHNMSGEEGHMRHGGGGHNMSGEGHMRPSEDGYSMSGEGHHEHHSEDGS